MNQDQQVEPRRGGCWEAGRLPNILHVPQETIFIPAYLGRGIYYANYYGGRGGLLLEKKLNDDAGENIK